jgi:hypothetical protein
MSGRELSMEERNKLMETAAVSMAITSFAFLAYFVYLMENKLLPTMWVFLLKWCLPFIMVGVLSGIITFEVGYHRKIKSPWKFHVKRLGGQLLLLATSTLSFVVFVGWMDEVLTPTMDGKGFLVGSFIFALAFAAVVLKFRRIVGKLQNGSW